MHAKRAHVTAAMKVVMLVRWIFPMIWSVKIPQYKLTRWSKDPAAAGTEVDWHRETTQQSVETRKRLRKLRVHHRTSRLHQLTAQRPLYSVFRL